jgi:hypothetical protein
MSFKEKGLFSARQDLFNQRVEWKREQGRAYGRVNDGISYIDGIIKGLTLAIETIDRYRKLLMLLPLLLSMVGCRASTSNDVMYGVTRVANEK